MQHPPVPLVLKFADWPEADRSAWDRLFRSAGLFDEDGALVRWSEGSRSIRRQAYGQWLSFLQRRVPECLSAEPANRVTKSAVKAYVEECQSRLAPVSVCGLLKGLAVIIGHMAVETDWSWLRRLVNRLRAQTGRGDLKAAPAISAAEIFTTALRHMVDADGDTHSSALQKAIHYRQCLMIATLISCPVRSRAFIYMDVSRHIVATASSFDFRFSAEDMKDKRARRFPMAENLVEPMRLYLDLYRPLLLQSATSDWLWIGKYGRPLTKDGYTRELPKITLRILGVALRPHAFRHVAATSVAEYDPKHVGIIRDVLGHATLEMAQKHYNRATANSSCNMLQSIVADIRRKAATMERLDN
jgi:hypothetical protein